MADRDGYVEAAMPGLARRANVSVPDCERAVKRLEGPDPYSKNPDNDGQRVESVPSGWTILNYHHYRELRDADVRREQVRLAVQKHRDKTKKGVIESNPEKAQGKPRKAHTEAEATAETKNNYVVGASPTVKKNTRSGKPSWMSPYAAVWREVMGGDPHWGKMAKFLKPLEDEHGTETVLPRLRFYLDQTEPKYVSLARFAETFGAWVPQPDPLDQPSSLGITEFADEVKP